MKITRTVEKTVTVEETDNIICNRCGLTCFKGDPGYGKSPYGLIEACVEGGYHSNALSDMTAYTFSVCEECLKVFFDACVVPPLVRSDGETIPYDPNWKANCAKRSEQWKENLRLEVEPFLPATPPGWVLEFDGQNFTFSEAHDDRNSPTISFWRLDGRFHITICRNHGETPISREEIERIHKLFIPELPLDTKLKGVEIYKAGTHLQERATGDDPISIATFSKEIR